MAGFLLLEDGSYLLLEDGTSRLIILEDVLPPTQVLLGQACLVLPFLLCVGWMFTLLL